ncbi:MAG: ribonuclease III [Bacilli bacterium]|nr:ribonuclease III [Bacilli bacterium]
MELLDNLKIKPNLINLYETAFYHTSYANENDTISYERLEFLGDAVLELLMSEYLYSRYEYDEGEMTKLRAHYVCTTANYEYSKMLGLEKYLKLGVGEEASGGRNRKAILADIFESFLGALYLDQGLDVVKKFFNENIIPHIENHEIDFFDDYKSVLQEYVQTDKKSLEYKLIEEKGPAHNREFKVEAIIDGIVYGVGIAGSKKAAEQKAAKDAISKAQKGRFKWEEPMK